MTGTFDPRAWYVDSGATMERTNGSMQAFLSEHGIVHQTSVPYTPEQNGVAERMNRTLVQKARCMLKRAHAIPRRAVDNKAA